MASKTIALSNGTLSGTSGLTMLLISPTDGSLGNGSGDTLTAGSNGHFSCTVTEAITGWWRVTVKNGGTVVMDGGWLLIDEDIATTYYVDDPYAPLRWFIRQLAIQQVAL